MNYEKCDADPFVVALRIPSEQSDAVTLVRVLIAFFASIAS